MTHKAEMSKRQTDEAADPQDLVVFQVKMSETAAPLKTTDLTETVVWEGDTLRLTHKGKLHLTQFLCQEHF